MGLRTPFQYNTKGRKLKENIEIFKTLKNIKKHHCPFFFINNRRKFYYDETAFSPKLVKILKIIFSVENGCENDTFNLQSLLEEFGKNI